MRSQQRVVAAPSVKPSVKKPGAVSRPGANHQFQFRQCLKGWRFVKYETRQAPARFDRSNGGCAPHLMVFKSGRAPFRFSRHGPVRSLARREQPRLSLPARRGAATPAPFRPGKPSVWSRLWCAPLVGTATRTAGTVSRSARPPPGEERARSLLWCCRKGLNFRPLPYQGSALPLSYGSAPEGSLSRAAKQRKWRESGRCLPQAPIGRKHRPRLGLGPPNRRRRLVS